MLSSRLVDCIDQFNTIATVGLCKNAGKTTVLNYLVEYYRKDFIVGITSIGYDGEETDAVTLLPKPRIAVFPGMLIATTSSCLLKTEVGYQALHNTGISTSLGDVTIVRALSAGYLEISGPSISTQVKQVSDKMFDLGCQKVIIDGAAGRLSFASHVDCAILSIGAALSTEMTKVVKQASHLARLLSLDVCPQVDQSSPIDQIYRVELVQGVPHFVFRGAMVDRDLEAIIAQSRDAKKVAVAKDATAIFISPKGYARFAQHGGSVQVKSRVNLVALTINPMSPYGPWFDETKFLQAMQQVSHLPVYNIMNEKVNSHEEQAEYRRVIGPSLSGEC